MPRHIRLHKTIHLLLGKWITPSRLRLLFYLLLWRWGWCCGRSGFIDLILALLFLTLVLTLAAVEANHISLNSLCWLHWWRGTHWKILLMLNVVLMRSLRGIRRNLTWWIESRGGVRCRSSTCVVILMRILQLTHSVRLVELILLIALAILRMLLLRPVVSFRPTIKSLRLLIVTWLFCGVCLILLIHKILSVLVLRANLSKGGGRLIRIILLMLIVIAATSSLVYILMLIYLVTKSLGSWLGWENSRGVIIS